MATWELLNRNHHECTKCLMRHPELVKQCFFCGSIDTIKFNPIKKEDKLKSPIKGSSLTFSFNKKGI